MADVFVKKWFKNWLNRKFYLKFKGSVCMSYNGCIIFLLWDLYVYESIYKFNINNASFSAVYKKKIVYEKEKQKFEMYVPVWYL